MVLGLLSTPPVDAGRVLLALLTVDLRWIERNFLGETK